MKLNKTNVEKRISNFLETSKKKQPNDRSNFLSPFMKKVSGDFGNSIIEAFTKGDKEKFTELWDQVTKTMLSKCGK